LGIEIEKKKKKKKKKKKQRRGVGWHGDTSSGRHERMRSAERPSR